jgi:WD40 repeat protein
MSVSDEDIGHLSKLSETHSLAVTLRGKEVTDDDAVKLSRLPLKRIGLFRTQVTQKGIDALHNALPDVGIMRSGGPFLGASLNDDARITQVVHGAPAETAGLKVGDIVRAFGGRKIKDSRELSKLLSRSHPGDVVQLEILRESQTQTVKLEVGKLVDVGPDAENPPRAEDAERTDPDGRVPGNDESPQDVNAQTIKTHDGRVLSVAFSPDEKLLATGGGSLATSIAELRIWDAQTGQLVHDLKGHTASVSTVAFSPDGTILAADDAGSIRLWDPQTGEQKGILQGHVDNVKCVAFSPDGKELASASYDGTVRFWDVSEMRETRRLRQKTARPDSDWLFAVAYSPDGRSFSVGRWDPVVTTYRLDTLTVGRPFDFGTRGNRQVYSLAYSPDGKTLATGSNEFDVRLWDVRTAAVRAVLKGHTSSVFAVAASPDGKMFATGSMDKTIGLWNARTGEELRVFKGHKEPVASVTFSPDGKILASGSGDGTDPRGRGEIRLWNVENRRSAAYNDSEEYDFRKSAEYAALSAEDRSRIEQVHRDLTLLWGALDQYVYDNDGSSPPSLNALVPVYLDELPKDPFATKASADAAPPGRFLPSLDGWGYRYLRGHSGCWIIRSVGRSLPRFHDFPRIWQRLGETKGEWGIGGQLWDASDLVIPIKSGEMTKGMGEMGSMSERKDAEIDNDPNGRE